MSILIKNCLLNQKETDVFIEENKISEISPKCGESADEIIDGRGKAIIPGLVNAHTHAAMTLLRGYADDMALNQWLEQKIWPLEAKLTEDDVYWGAKLACLEMIKSGTTFFNDMYWHWSGTARAVNEMGIRAAISLVFIDNLDPEKAKEQIKLNEKIYRENKNFGKRIIFAMGPHSIYTVSEQSLVWIKEFAQRNGLPIHIHVSETKEEVDNCIKTNKLRPIEYLDKIGFLGPNVIACHCVWVNKNEIDILSKNHVKVVINPTSNMKLASGLFPYKEMKNKLTVCLGTDGCSSNNNLDMLEAMKIAALSQKINSNDPMSLSAKEAFDMGTINGAKAFNLNCGEIKEGKLADILLIDLKKPEMMPMHDLTSNLVYSANGSCVDTVICDGKIIMKGGKVENEEKIIEKANDVAKELVKR